MFFLFSVFLFCFFCFVFLNKTIKRYKLGTILTLDISTCIKGQINVLILSECRPGFFGLYCLQTCAENFYGILCESKCDCIETQICHHECGCLPVSSLTNDSSTTKNETSSYFTESCPTSTTVVPTGQCINYCKTILFCTSNDLFNISVISITY